MLISYGPHANCTLDLCNVSTSVYQYRPSLPASAIFIALFAISMVLQIVQGFRWRTWAFLAAMVLGNVSEMIGYGGRIILWYNPFSFTGFMVQIVCITLAPAFYSAAIYLMLSKIVVFLGVQYSRLPPKLYYWIFIPCDLVSLVVQGVGGGQSSSSSGSSQTAVYVAIAGLSFQVFTLAVFILLALDYAVRYLRLQSPKTKLSLSFKIFVGFLSLSVLCILIRCIYRIDELSDGYRGPLIHNEGLFVGLEGVLIVIAAFALNVAHPGPIFGRSKPEDLELPGAMTGTTGHTFSEVK